jgi:hypothetical protein
MNSTAEGQKRARRYATGRILAPHVDQKWAETFAVELRLLGVQGSRIGDALSEVESHCAESGESGQQAFGDPEEYARGLQLPAHADTSARALLRSVTPTILQVLGMLMLLWGFAAWREGGQLEITTAHLVTTTVFLLVALALIRFADRVLRFVNRQPLSLFIILMAFTAAVIFSFQFLVDVIWRLAAGWSLAAGAVALIGGVVWAITHHRAHGSQDGPITSPLSKTGTQPDGDTRGPLLRLLSSPLLGIARISLSTVILLAVTWWLTR